MNVFLISCVVRPPNALSHMNIRVRFSSMHFQLYFYMPPPRRALYFKPKPSEVKPQSSLECERKKTAVAAAAGA